MKNRVAKFNHWATGYYNNIYRENTWQIYNSVFGYPTLNRVYYYLILNLYGE